MFEKIFTTILRTVALPYVFFLILSAGLLEEDQAWLVVSITLTLSVAVSIILQAISLLPKLVLLKGNKLLLTLLAMTIEIGAVAGFWYYYLAEYN